MATDKNRYKVLDLLWKYRARLATYKKNITTTYQAEYWTGKAEELAAVIKDIEKYLETSST